MTNKIIFLIAILLTSISALQAQNNVGIGTNTPDSSAALDISSTNKGLLIPRVSLADVNTIAPLTSATPGLLVYNTNLNINNGYGLGFYYWDGFQWVKMLNSTTPLNFWSRSGNPLANNTGAFIGTTDNYDLVFKRNNITSGRIGNFSTSFGRNTDGGYGGDLNTAFGSNALALNAGSYNVGIGTEANQYNHTGSYNTSIGHHSGIQTFSTAPGGDYNTAIGANSIISLFANNATAIGANSSATENNTFIIGGDYTSSYKVKVGIGTSTPQADLVVKQSNTTPGIQLIYGTSGINWTTWVDGGNNYNFSYGATLKGYINDVNGQYVAVSDRRLKKDITDVKNVLPNLLKLQAKTYHYKDNKEGSPLSYGFIAQEVEQLFPEFVDTKEDTGMKAIAYDNFAVIAIQAIKEQQTIIDQQQNDMEKLKREMQELRNLITTKNK